MSFSMIAAVMFAIAALAELVVIRVVLGLYDDSQRRGRELIRDCERRLDDYHYAAEVETAALRTRLAEVNGNRGGGER